MDGGGKRRNGIIMRNTEERVLFSRQFYKGSRQQLFFLMLRTLAKYSFETTRQQIEG